MSNYDRHKREIGQIDSGGLELQNFMGPVELWYSQDSGKYFTYLHVDPSDLDKYMNVNRDSYEEIGEIFSYVCNIVASLPDRHPLNTTLSPYSPSV